MINKKISSTFGILVVLVIAVLLGTIFLIDINKTKTDQISTKEQPRDSDKNTLKILDKMNLKIIYPKEWGVLEYGSKTIKFSDIKNEKNNLEIRVITIDDIIAESNIIPLESPIYDLSYIDYLRNISENDFKYNCEKDIFSLGFDRCFKPNKKEINGQKYITQINFSVAPWSDWRASKKWTLFLGDKIIIVENDLKDISTKNLDDKIYTDNQLDSSKLDSSKIEKLSYEDLGINEEFLSEITNDIENFLQQVSFQNLNSNYQIYEKLIEKDKFIKDLKESKEASSPERLDELSKSNFFMIKIA